MDNSASILLICPACKSRRQVGRELAGTPIRCRQCTAELTVPEPEDVSDELLLAGDALPPLASPPATAQKDPVEELTLGPAVDPLRHLSTKPFIEEDYRVAPAAATSPMVKAVLLASPPPAEPPPAAWVPPPEKKTLVWAFSSRVFTFAWQSNAFPQWVVLSALMFGSGWLITFGARFLNSGFGALGGGCLCAVGFFIGIAACSYGSACLIAIIENTAYHMDRDGRWPEHDYREWLFYLLRLIYLLAMSGLVAGIPMATAGFMNPMAGAVVAAIAVYLAFPILLLSALEANSPLWPISPPILRTLATDAGAWLAFYSVSGLMWLAWNFGTGVLHTVSPGLSLLASSAFGAAAWFSYARLIGRLASIIMHLEDREQERAAAKAK